MLMVLVAAMLHAGWNTFVKSKSDKLVGSALVCFGAAIVGAPLLLFLSQPLPESIPYIIVSGIVHSVYFLFLGFAYRNADFSVVYPVMRGLIPIITTLAAAFWLNEWLGSYALTGVIILSVGILWLSINGFCEKGINGIGMVFALSNGFVIAGYSLIDGVGARLSANPVTYNLWVGIASALCFAPFVFWYRGWRLIDDIQTEWRFGLIGGGMALAGYGIVIWAMTKAPIGLVIALRETSIIIGLAFAALWGQVRRCVMQKNFWKRDQRSSI